MSTEIEKTSTANKPWHQAPRFILVLKCLLALIVAMVIFQLGMFVGFKKATFSFGYGDNYHLIFGGPSQGLMRGGMGKNFMNGHGIAGSVISVDTNSIIIESRDRIEMKINITEKTSIIRGRTKAILSEIKSGDIITAIGKPTNSGEVQADIIRVLNPEPPFPPPLNRPQGF